MNTGVRFWLMIALLATASLGLRLLSHGEAVPLSKPLTTLPKDLQGWHGADAPIEPRVIKAAGVDDYLSRAYWGKDQVPVFLYVGYYHSQRTGQTIHSPKNCLPGAGWEPVSSGRILLTLPDGKRALVNLYVIENGLQRQLVLYWYQSHGRVVASEYQGKIYLVLDALRLNRTDAALVRISTTIRGDVAFSRLRAIDFAQSLLGPLDRLLPN